MKFKSNVWGIWNQESGFNIESEGVYESLAAAEKALREKYSKEQIEGDSPFATIVVISVYGT